ncbi:GNAT family N-acetyltransferase, partial [Alphaproteobacteria bacterium]|nr:GNAT family N-acetyltransferase [Alphaproteobacteria bacterium]
MVSSSDNFYFINSINKVALEDWNNCVGLDHPFTRYEFLSALENSNSAIKKTGWEAFHYIEENNEKKIIAVCPLYIKTHSFGEYIFDHAWAEAYHRNGLSYYPKLQSAIPFTPVTGERIIIRKDIKNHLTKKLNIINRIIDKIKKNNISSLHFNFLTDPLKL